MLPTMMILLLAFIKFSYAHGSGVKSIEYFPNRTDFMIIIARYEEPVDHLGWLKDYPHVIYNRGPAIVTTSSEDNKDTSNVDVLSSLRTVDVLDNVGRESFIYLSHIVHSYHKLHEINIFSQAVQRVESVNWYNDNNFKKDIEDLVVM